MIITHKTKYFKSFYYGFIDDKIKDVGWDRYGNHTPAEERLIDGWFWNSLTYFKNSNGNKKFILFN